MMSTIEQQVSESLHGFLRDNFLGARPDVRVGEDDPLLDGGIIDSMGVLELLAFIEEHHGVRIEDHEVNSTNLGSIGAIVRLVAAKRAA